MNIRSSICTKIAYVFLGFNNTSELSEYTNLNKQIKNSSKRIFVNMKETWPLIRKKIQEVLTLT